MLLLAQSLLWAAGFEYDGMGETWVTRMPVHPPRCSNATRIERTSGSTDGSPHCSRRHRLRLLQLRRQRRLCQRRWPISSCQRVA